METAVLYWQLYPEHLQESLENPEYLIYICYLLNE